MLFIYFMFLYMIHGLDVLRHSLPDHRCLLPGQQFWGLVQRQSHLY